MCCAVLCCASGNVTTIKTSQPLNPFSILVHPSSHTLIVSDDDTHSVLQVNPVTGPPPPHLFI
jgi:hypothetical protein